MSNVAEIRKHLDALKFETLSLRAEMKFETFIRAMKAGFNQDQPRDDQGRWSEAGGSNEDTADDMDLPLVIMAARRTFSLAECEAQYKRDTFHCNMVGLMSCHRQAAQRYAACLGGTQIPPLSY